MTSPADWDARYRAATIEGVAPARVLSENAHLLPAAGRALDVACGLGGNARFLARRGLETIAYDSSIVAINKLNAYAQRHALPLHAEHRDMEENPPGADGFDVAVVAYFLERRLAKPIMDALRPGGLLFYQTFIRDHVDSAGPRNPAYRLERNELLILFAPLKILFYREEGRAGDTSRGFRNEAMLVAQKDSASAE